MTIERIDETMAKIDIISGFLGAGKTTLIKKLIAEAEDYLAKHYKKDYYDVVNNSCKAAKAEENSRYEKVKADLKSEHQKKIASLKDAEEIKAYLQEKFADVIATGNKGQIMKAVMADLKGKADGKLINGIVAELMK